MRVFPEIIRGARFSFWLSYHKCFRGMTLRPCGHKEFLSLNVDPELLS